MITNEDVLNKIEFVRQKVIKNATMKGKTISEPSDYKLAKNNLYDRAIVLPLSGGIDSTLLLYEMAYGKINPCHSIFTPVSRIKFVTFEHNLARSSKFDSEWLSSFIKTEEYRILKTMIEFFNCNPWGSISAKHRVSVESINMTHENLSNDEELTNRTRYENRVIAAPPYRNTYFTCACIPAMTYMLNCKDTIYLGLLKGETEEIAVNIKNLERNLNDLLDNVINIHKDASLSWLYGNGSNNQIKSDIKIITPLDMYTKAECTEHYNLTVPREIRNKANLFIAKKDKTDVNEKKYQRYIKDTDDTYMKNTYGYDGVACKLRLVRRAYEPIVKAILEKKYNKAMRLYCDSAEAIYKSSMIGEVPLARFAVNILRYAAEDPRSTKRSLTILFNIFNRSSINY